MDNKHYYEGMIAKLESKVDLLEAELVYLDKVLSHCGFPEGIQTLKKAVEEMLLDDPEFVDVRKQIAE